MRLGIDFGTTRIVAAAADRGNYPVIAFECPDGAAREWVPPLIAIRGGERHYGWQAWALQGDPGVTAVRSLKRVLADAGPGTLINLGPAAVPLNLLLEEMTAALRQQLLEASSLHLRAGESLEIMLGVPANANSNQRFLTVEGFRAGGFEVLGLLNEPSAASIEYAHRLAAADSAVPEHILVYDLGGGTFDASLVERDGASHTVLATESIPTLGGEDFDEVLAELALELAGRTAERHAFSAAEEFLLLEECREKKESLHPNTRRLIIDLDTVRDGWGQVSVPVNDFYDACRPLIDETLHAAGDLLARTPLAGAPSLYITGGASELPLVARLLREQFGRRVKRSAYTRAATAIGLAIQSDTQSHYRLREAFTRWFGVWREADAGRLMVFDALFDKATPLPAAGEPPLLRSRRYQPVHNIGHFRYLECTHRDSGGTPRGDVTAWDEIRFPFDPAFATLPSLDSIPITHSDAASRHWIEERYEAGAHGGVTVTIANLTADYHRTYRLGRWADQPVALSPRKSPRRRKQTAG
jgi:molecular chaperone DnaK (HSP70)